MRWILAITIGLVVLLAAYTVWPLAGLYQFAGAVERKDRAALEQQIDLPRMRRSLAEQIIGEYLKLTGKTQRLGALGTRLATGIGATVADPIVERLLNFDTLADLLDKGSASGVIPGANANLLAPFSASALSSVWQTWLGTEYTGTRFWVSLPPDHPPAEQFKARLDLHEWQWKLTGIELPEQLRVQLAQEVIRTNPEAK